jgi:hypothetical protein
MRCGHSDFRDTGADGKYKVWRTFLKPNVLTTFPNARAPVLFSTFVDSASMCMFEHARRIL